MICQNCQQNEATIHLYANVNGQRKQLDYCQSCYQKLKNQANNSPQNMGQDPFGFGSLDDLYRSLSRQMQQGNPMNNKHHPLNLVMVVMEVNPLAEALALVKVC